MINCPVGTIRTDNNAYDLQTHCVPCPAGSYCLEESAAVSGVCETGHYCPTSITNVFASVPTAIGSYGPKQVYSCLYNIHFGSYFYIVILFQMLVFNE